MKIGYFALTERGFQLADRLRKEMPGEIFPKTDLKQHMESAWRQCDALVCVMAAGIVVRSIAPLFESKDRDPAVIVMDSQGQWVISLLSGHLGGGNELAQKLAAICGGQPVLTTATDVEGVLAFDEVAKKNRLLVENLKALKYVSGNLLDNRAVNLVIDPLYTLEDGKKTLYLRPQTLVVGVGCKKGMDVHRMSEAFEQFVKDHIPLKQSIRALATIDIKAGEPAILSLAEALEVPLMVIPRKLIENLDFENVPGGPLTRSVFVEKTIGVGSVAEACAYLGAEQMAAGRYLTGRRTESEFLAKLSVKKEKYEGMTFAAAEMMQKIEL